MPRFVIVSDNPFQTEKSGYANQMYYFLTYFLQFYKNYEIIIIGIGNCLTVNVDKESFFLDSKSIVSPEYLEFVKEHNIKFYSGRNNRQELFSILHNLQKEIHLEESDKILFYCDLVSYPQYSFTKLLPKTYYWYPCHTSFIELHQVEKNYLNLFPIFSKISTFSKYGMNVINTLGYDCHFINHAIDDKKYITMSKKNLRKKYGISEDSFVALMIGRNNDSTDRKAFKENLEGFKLFLDSLDSSQSSKIYLLLHPIFLINDQGIDINKLIEDLHIKKHTILVNNHYQKLNETEITELYNVSDVLLHNSKVEGFGLTSVEAQFCGLPVIVTDCTAMSENCYLGIKTKPINTKNNVNGINCVSSPNPDEICKALHQVRNNSYEKNKIPKDKYNINFIFKNWNYFLNLQNTNQLLSISNEKILFVFMNELHLINNLLKLKNQYPNGTFVVVNNASTDPIYTQLTNIPLSNILHLTYKSKVDFFTIYKQIYEQLGFHKYYFMINNLQISKHIDTIIDNQVYYSSSLQKCCTNESSDIDILMKKYLQKDLYNNYLLTKNKPIDIFTGNLLLSSENLTKFINYFKDISISNIDELQLFNYAISIYLKQQNSQELDIVLK